MTIDVFQKDSFLQVILYILNDLSKCFDFGLCQLFQHKASLFVILFVGLMKFVAKLSDQLLFLEKTEKGGTSCRKFSLFFMIIGIFLAELKVFVSSSEPYLFEFRRSFLHYSLWVLWLEGTVITMIPYTSFCMQSFKKSFRLHFDLFKFLRFSFFFNLVISFPQKHLEIKVVAIKLHMSFEPELFGYCFEVLLIASLKLFLR